MTDSQDIKDIILKGATARIRSAEIEMEKHKALSDLLVHNQFIVHGFEDRRPYLLGMEIIERSLFLTVHTQNDVFLTRIEIRLSAFQRLIKDYFIICESYYTLIKNNDRSKIEAADMGRRALHNEGAEMLMHKLKKYAECNFATARQLFTLICILHIRIARV